MDPIIEGILNREGGLVDHPDDPGGLTNWGLTLPFLAELLDREVSREELKGMTQEQAAGYYAQWMKKTRLAEIPVDILRAHVVDYAVNSGLGTAIKALQFAVGVPQDGRIGPDTLGAVARANAAEAVSRLSGRRLSLLAYLLDKPYGKVFIKGWLKRLSSLMVGGETK